MIFYLRFSFRFMSRKEISHFKNFVILNCSAEDFHNGCTIKQNIEQSDACRKGRSGGMEGCVEWNQIFNTVLSFAGTSAVYLEPAM